MATRREELTRIAARLFAAKGYQGTSLADLASALGVQKPSLYHHIASKEDLLWEVARDGAAAFHAGLDALPEDAPGRERFVTERRRYEERIRDLFREGVENSELRTDLDVGTAALLFLSAANWAYTWLRPGGDTDALGDRMFALLLDGMRGYATPA